MWLSCLSDVVLSVQVLGRHPLLPDACGSKACILSPCL